MSKISNETILKANRKTKHSINGRTAIGVGGSCVSESMTIATTYRGKCYSVQVTVDALRLSFGKAVKSSRAYGKGV